MKKIKEDKNLNVANEEVGLTGNEFICGLACVVLCGVGGFWATASSMVSSYV